VQVQEIVQSLLEYHGMGLARMFEPVKQAGAAGQTILAAWANDDVVRGLLLLYSLHPMSLEQRVRQALDQVRPYLRSHGGGVELVGVSDGLVRLRMQGSCQSCPSSALTLKGAVEASVYQYAPDVTEIRVEGLEEDTAGPSTTFVPVEQLGMSLERLAQPAPKGRMNHDPEPATPARACSGHNER
jgi:Fe-S cluster biogenesis protein NfuA